MRCLVLFGGVVKTLFASILLSEGPWWMLNYQTLNDKVECQKGNSPEQVFKVPKFLLSESKEVFKLYNQEIGLEAAIF